MLREQDKKTLAKEIGRISRNFLEIAVENHRCLTACMDFLAKKGSIKTQEFLQEKSGMGEWLTSINEFSKQVRRHVQEGRLSLMNYLGEKQAFALVSDLQNKRIDKKSTLLTQLDEMLQSVFDLRSVAKEEKPGVLVGNRLLN